MISIALSSALVSAACSFGAPPCEGLSFFDNIVDWTAVTSGAALVVTFEEPAWPVDQVLVGTWTVDGISFTGLAGTPRPNIFVADFGSPFATQNWLVANGDESIDIVPSSPTSAFAMDAASNQFGEAFITVFGAGDVELGNLVIPASTARFVGITSTLSITKVHFSSTRGAIANTGIDNVRLASYSVDLVGDIDGDGHVNGSDLAILLGAWNGSGPADLNCDGNVDASDLAILLGAWTG